MGPIYDLCFLAFLLTVWAIKAAFEIPWLLAFALTTMFTVIIGVALLCGALVATLTI